MSEFLEKLKQKALEPFGVWCQASPIQGNSQEKWVKVKDVEALWREHLEKLQKLIQEFPELHVFDVVVSLGDSISASESGNDSVG